MIGVGKMPVVGYFNNRFRPILKLFHLLGSWTVGAKINRRLGIFPGGGRPSWIDKSLVGHDQELAVRAWSSTSSASAPWRRSPIPFPVSLKVMLSKQAVKSE